VRTFHLLLLRLVEQVVQVEEEVVVRLIGQVVEAVGVVLPFLVVLAAVVVEEERMILPVVQEVGEVAGVLQVLIDLLEVVVEVGAVGRMERLYLIQGVVVAVEERQEGRMKLVERG
jgi:hypothetical protein